MGCPDWGLRSRSQAGLGPWTRFSVGTGIRCDACDVVLDFIDQGQACHRVVNVPVGQDVSEDYARSIDTEMEFLPAPLALASVLCGRPLAFANDREPSAVDDEMSGFARGDS